MSRPLSSGWKPVPISSKLATRPRMRISPSVGAVMRLISFSMVDLPAPLRPSIATASPRFTPKVTSFSAQNFWLWARCSLPILTLGSSLPRTRANQLVRSPCSVPPPIMPRRYSLETPSTSRTRSDISGFLSCAVADVEGWRRGRRRIGRGWVNRYTVSINVFSVRENSITPSRNTTTVTITDSRL